MRNAIEALGDIRIKGKLRLQCDCLEDGVDSVMARTARTKAITIGLETRFPLGFERLLDQAFQSTIRASPGYPAA